MNSNSIVFDYFIIHYEKKLKTLKPLNGFIFKSFYNFTPISLP